MSIRLGPNQYGKAENRVVRVYRDGVTPGRHDLRDLNVTTLLRGDFHDVHVTGDQAHGLPTDTQKNTAFAYALQHGVSSPEDYALALARRLLTACTAADEAVVSVEEYAWDRVPLGPHGHDHTFVRRGTEVRTTEVTVGTTRTVRSGLSGLVLLKTTGSEYAGFQRDEFTTLEDAHDRILATSLTATWTHRTPEDRDWDAAYAAVRATLVETFATTHSLAMQHSLFEMGKAALEAHDHLADVSLKAPNQHHFLVDLAPFGLENDGEVYIAADRPYGLIEATVVRDDA